MSDFLSSVRADLLDRRMRPFLALVVVALVAALGYALLGGGGSASVAPGPGSAGTGSGASGINVSASTANANRAASEVTGSSKQRGGSARNPFAPLPGSKSSSSSSSSSSSNSSGGSPSTSSGSESGISLLPTGGGGTSSGGALPTTPKETTPAKPKPSYSVDVLFGATTAGTPPQNAQLTPYADLAFQQKLPSPQDRLVSFAGVVSDGKLASFKLVGEVILRGPATCLPTPIHCEAIALAPGQTEELERLPAAGPPEVFDLQVVSITPNS
jgi:hypothetical protein